MSSQVILSADSSLVQTVYRFCSVNSNPNFAQARILQLFIWHTLACASTFAIKVQQVLQSIDLQVVLCLAGQKLVCFAGLEQVFSRESEYLCLSFLIWLERARIVYQKLLFTEAIQFRFNLGCLGRIRFASSRLSFCRIVRGLLSRYLFNYWHLWLLFKEGRISLGSLIIGL